MAGPPKKSRGVKDSELTFEEALERLEEVARQLEGGELPLEQAIALAEESLQLSQLCEERLKAAEGKIQQLVARMGRPELEPFAPDEGEEE